MLPMYELITQALKLVRGLTMKFNLKNITKTKFGSLRSSIGSHLYIVTHFNWSLWIINVSAKFKTFLTRRYILIFVILVGWMHHTITPSVLKCEQNKLWHLNPSKMFSASVSQSDSQPVLGILSVVKYISDLWAVSCDPPGVAGWSCWPATLHKDLIYWEKFVSWIPAILIIHVIIQLELNWSARGGVRSASIQFMFIKVVSFTCRAQL